MKNRIFLNNFFITTKKFPRRDFLKLLGGTVALGMLSSFLPWFKAFGQTVESSPGAPDFDLLTVKGKDYPCLLREGLKLMGFPARFLKKGAKVVIKPNAGWSRTPEQAANTHPLLVAEMVKACREAGAGSVEVVEHSCDNYKSAFRVSGIQEAVEKAGVKMISLSEIKDFIPVAIPGGKSLKTADVSRKILEAELFINMPIAKVHGSAVLTMAMKNHMGTVKERWPFHARDLHQCIADISSYLRPHLNILDCTRILTSKGPKGPGNVKILDQIILGTDQVAVDAYGTTLFGMKPDDIGYLKAARKMGLGETDLSKIRVKQVNLG